MCDGTPDNVAFSKAWFRIGITSPDAALCAARNLPSRRAGSRQGGKTVLEAGSSSLEQAWLQFLTVLQMWPGFLRGLDGLPIVNSSTPFGLVKTDRRKVVGRIAGVVNRARRSAQAHIMLHRGFLISHRIACSAGGTETRTLREQMARIGCAGRVANSFGCSGMAFQIPMPVAESKADHRSCQNGRSFRLKA